MRAAATRLAPLLNGVEQADPTILSVPKGETRATEYSKAATRGQWNEVWDSLDKRQKVKTGPAANEDGGGEDMFARAGVAAE